MNPFALLLLAFVYLFGLGWALFCLREAQLDRSPLPLLSIPVVTGTCHGLVIYCVV